RAREGRRRKAARRAERQKSGPGESERHLAAEFAGAAGAVEKSSWRPPFWTPERDRTLPVAPLPESSNCRKQQGNRYEVFEHIRRSYLYEESALCSARDLRRSRFRNGADHNDEHRRSRCAPQLRPRLRGVTCSARRR